MVREHTCQITWVSDDDNSILFAILICAQRMCEFRLKNIYEIIKKNKINCLKKNPE